MQLIEFGRHMLLSLANPVVVWTGLGGTVAVSILIGRRIVANTTRQWQLAVLPIWLIFLTVCLLLLSGRYDWGAKVRPYSWRGYFSSAYMLVITLPTLYYLLKFFLRQDTLVRVVLVMVALFFTLPYRWLGLDRWYYHLNQPTFWTSSYPPTPDWLPQALQNLRSMPYEVLFFISLAFLGLVIAFAYIWQRQKLAGLDLRLGLYWAAPWLGLYLLLLIQTWLHLSMRSPYVYIVGENPGEIASAKYLFPQEQGAVNIDYHVFRDLEEHFMGTPRVTQTMLIRRSFLFYLSSQVSYFFSPYYVFLILNIGLWFIACLCAYHWARLFWTGPVAPYFTFLVGCGPGFIMYVAQPMSYLAGYAIIIILLYLFEALIVSNPNRTIASYLLFGSSLGLGLMVYDIFPFFAFFFGYAYLRQLSPLKLFVSFMLAGGIYFGFIFLQGYGLKLQLDAKNIQYLGLAFDDILRLLIRPHLGELYVLTASFFRLYFGSLGNAFFVLPVVLAMAGAFLLRNRFQAVLIFLLALPAWAPLAILHYGQVHWNGIPLASLPRFGYVAYPFIYLLAATFLVKIQTFLIQHGRPGLAYSIPLMFLLSIFVLNNVDVMGYPQMYYLFYFADVGN